MNLSDVLKDDATRASIIDDVVGLIDGEVGKQKGLSGMAVKAGYKLVQGVKAGFRPQRGADAAAGVRGGPRADLQRGARTGADRVGLLLCRTPRKSRRPCWPSPTAGHKSRTTEPSKAPTPSFAAPRERTSKPPFPGSGRSSRSTRRKHVEYFEDIVVGTVRESTETYELTSEEIVEFCSKWDPLPFHVDERAAAATPVGKLFTSAIHSIAIAIRLGHEMNSEPTATEIGLGWDEVRFHVPACAGDRLRLRGEVLETRLSTSKPHLGIIQTRLTLLNQRRETVVSLRAAAMVRRRPQAS